MSQLFPFTAIIGQEKMKRALIVNAIDQLVGGVLISGTRGTAKSTAARALAALLPQIDVIPGDIANAAPPKDFDGNSARIPTPFVNLPVGATEDRVTGMLDVERMLQFGERRFEPGLLARANRGVLYIDEVNLLPDHLVDVILDVAAMGVNRVEREGVSFQHEARVMLVGTMNPEEGELRPQLLDRFGLFVTADGYFDPRDRKEVVRRRIAFDENPSDFVARWCDADLALSAKIAEARRNVNGVAVNEECLDEIARICAEAGAEGLRADIVIYKAARALAAFDGRKNVAESDIAEASEMALAHRRKRSSESQAQAGGGHSSSGGQDSSSENGASSPSIGQGVHAAPNNLGSKNETSAPETVFAVERELDVTLPKNKALRRRLEGEVFGRRFAGAGRMGRGAYVRAVKPRMGEASKLALSATVLAAACDWQAYSQGNIGFKIKSHHLRARSHIIRERSLTIFIVDASGSMAAMRRMQAAKGAVCALLEEAYQKRDSVAFVTMRGERAEETLPPTQSSALAYRRLQTLSTGGRTPLADGLRLALRIVTRQLRKEKSLRPFIVLVTDGRATSPDGNGFELALREARRVRERKIDALCIDAESGRLRFQQAAALAAEMSAAYRHISTLHPKLWGGVVREWIKFTERRTS